MSILNVASSDIVEHGIAKDIRKRIFLTDVLASLANDYSQLGLPINPFRDRWINDNVVIRTIHRSWSLGEKDRIFWRRRLPSTHLGGLFRVLSIIPAQAHDIFAWTWDRSCEMYIW